MQVVVGISTACITIYAYACCDHGHMHYWPDRGRFAGRLYIYIYTHTSRAAARVRDGIVTNSSEMIPYYGGLSLDAPAAGIIPY